MSLVDATLFIDRIVDDDEFAQELSELLDNPTDVVVAVRNAGYDVTVDEVRDVFLERFGDILPEEELAAIAGGIVQGDDILARGMPTGRTPGMTAAAAAA
jgi:predicted ribosomally synthesized peptide with nif11-like leader